MFSELPEVKELLVLLKDSVLHINRKKHIEVIEESDVSEDGIQLELDLQLLEPDNWVIITEPKSTKKSTELPKEPNQTMPEPLLI
jgi:hypothetical protein